MSRRQLVIFTAVLLLVSAISLAYGAQVLADLQTLYQNPTEPLAIELILSPHRTSTTIDDATLLAAQQVVNQRLENLHLAGAYTVTPHSDQLLVRLPPSDNMPYITSVLSSIGEIEFISGGSHSPPIGQAVITAAQANPDQNVYQTLFTGQEIVAAALPDSTNGEIFYQLTLKPAAVERFSAFIKNPDRQYICTVLDEQVINCSLMYHWTGNTLEILPGLSSGTVISLADLGIFLDSGPLPAPLKVELR